MVLALQVPRYEVGEQVLEDVRGVLQPPLQGRHDERGDVAAVAHGEGALQLQRADERQQEDLVVQQLSELLQGLLHVRLAAPRQLRGATHSRTHTHGHVRQRSLKGEERSHRGQRPLG